MSDEAQLQILIDIRAKIDALTQTGEGLKHVAEDANTAHEAASNLGALFAQGLGIGGGMELARRAVDLFRESFVEAVRQSSQFAAEIERAHGRLGLSAEAYQTLAAEARAAGTDFQEMTASMAQYRQRLGETLLDPKQGAVLRQLGLDARALANLPLQQQLELVATALGKITDGNVRARMSQELFGRGSTAILPLLEKLRTEGYEKLRATAAETNAELGDGMAKALNRAGNQLEESQKRLAVALAPLNLKIIETKTLLANMLAKNAGPIQSGIEAAFAGALVASIEKGLDRVAKDGGLTKAFESFGKAMVGPFGIGFAAALGTFIIKELERRALDANARSDSFDANAHKVPGDMLKALPQVTSDEDVRLLYNKAVTAYQQAQIDRKKLIMTPAQDVTDETKDNIRSLEQEMDLLARLIPMIKQMGPAYVEVAEQAKDTYKELVDRQTMLMVIELNHQNFQSAAVHTAKELANVGLKSSTHELESREEEMRFLNQKTSLLQEIIDLTEKMPVKTADDQADRDREILKLQAQIAAANIQYRNTVGPVSDAKKTRDKYKAFSTGENEDGSARLNTKQGVTAGAEQWVMSLGTQGEQVASALQSSLGATVNSITQGIYGWITGTQSFGDVLRNLGSTILQTLLQTIIQMGVQWVVSAALAKISLLGIHLLGSTLRKAEATETVATEATKTPVLATNAAMASASSFGLSAIIGLALLAALVAAFAFREHGGPVTAGQPYIVGEKRAEVFVPDQNGRILPRVEDYAVPAPAAARALAPAPAVASSSAFGAALGGSGSGSRSNNVHVYLDKSAYFEAIRSDVSGIAHEVYGKFARS